MKKLNAEEGKDYLPITHGRTTMIYAAILSLQINEVLIITRQEWKAKKPPYEMVSRLSNKTGRVFIKGRTPDGTGWAVKRIS